METSTFTNKGQVVIPKNLRKKYGIKPGMKVFFTENKGVIEIHVFTKEYFQNKAGWLKTEKDVLKDLLIEKK